jgi:hypothetical protein
MLSTSKTLFCNPSAGGGVTDPSFAYVPLLLNTGSTNGQQNNTFLDSSTNNFTITRNGTPTQGSITPYWPNGQWSNLFAANGDYISVPDAANLELGNSDFQMSAWIYLTAYPANNAGSYSSSILSKGTFAGTRSYEFGVGGASGTTLGLGLTNTGATSTNIAGSFSFALNTWYAVRATRVSNRVYLFVNGNLLNAGGTAYTDTVSNGTDTLKVGRSNLDATYLFQFFGYISNVSLAIGGSGYSIVSYIPATTPTTTVTSDIKFLSCQSNRFRDNSSVPATVSVFGTPTVQAFQPFSPTASYTTALYGGSGYFNGSTDYLTTPSNAAFAIGAGDFTIEGWVYTTAALTTNVLFAVAINDGLTLYVTGGNLIVRSFDTADLLSSSTIPTLNAWTHIAATRSGTSLRIFVNGVQTATTTNSTNFPQGQAVVGAGSLVGAAPWVGYVSNFRLVKGTAVYTANFTPPTAPVTAITNTSLLLNMTNAGIYDAAAQNNAITVGDAQASTTITAQWPPTSMKFDGTGDWLTAIDNPQLQLGTGNFTIEGWVYLSAIGVVYGVLSKGTATTGWSVNITVLNRLQFSYTASNLTGTTTLATGTWYYFAVVRSGSATGNLKLYLNGSLEATSGGAVTDNFNQTDILYVGASRTGTTPLNGYLEDIRITKAARTITASPTAAFPTR